MNLPHVPYASLGSGQVKIFYEIRNCYCPKYSKNCNHKHHFD